VSDLDEIRASLARIPNPIALLESLFALAPVGLQIYEAQGRSLLVNQAFIKLFGSEPPPGYNVLQDEIAEKNGVLGLIHRAFAGETIEVPPVWYDARELQRVRVETAHRVAMSATFFPLIGRDGRVTHVGVFFRDLTAEFTEREKGEQERARLRTLIAESAAREAEREQSALFRERFIGILGHDLRTPLTSIMAGAGLLLRQSLPDAAQGTATRIARSADRMERMIRDLLDFAQARLGSGLQLQRADCDVHEVAQAVLDEVLLAHPTRRVELESSGDTRGRFDADRIAQLLSNLLENAIRYAPEDGVISVKVNGAASEVAVGVHNGGPAIPEAERRAIFDPFRRGERTTDGRGLGLGLFIVEQIALAHGGRVEVISSDRGGTTFRVALQR
jgi:signal transduction histidine kinase